MLTTRSQLEAMRAELAATREADRRAVREEAQQAIAALRTEMEEAVAALRLQAGELAGAVGELRSDLSRWREDREDDRQRLFDLREGLDRLREDVSGRDAARERLQNTVAKLDHRMEQHADELQTATAALFERLATVRP